MYVTLFSFLNCAQGVFFIFSQKNMKLFQSLSQLLLSYLSYSDNCDMTFIKKIHRYYSVVFYLHIDFLHTVIFLTDTTRKWSCGQTVQIWANFINNVIPTENLFMFYSSTFEIFIFLRLDTGIFVWMHILLPSKYAMQCLMMY